MRHRLGRPAAGILVALLAASCTTISAPSRAGPAPGAKTPPVRGSASGRSASQGFASAGPPPASTRSLAGSASPPCRRRQLALGPGPRLSPATDERGDIYLLINRGSFSCTLAGYPGVTLYDAGGARLRFRYLDGQSQYVTSARPAAVVLRPGGRAYFLVAQAGCTLGNERAAATIAIMMPRPSHATLTGRASSGSSGVSRLNYCRAGPDGERAPVFLSPVEATFRATTQPPPSPVPQPAR
ncbi:MAG: DUF4232 domain-containing protein [Streptosporangiaceae bacterium]